eukprot:1159467-Pelagomonas_calceolata.AAC.6
MACVAFVVSPCVLWRGVAFVVFSCVLWRGVAFVVSPCVLWHGMAWPLQPFPVACGVAFVHSTRSACMWWARLQSERTLAVSGLLCDGSSFCCLARLVSFLLLLLVSACKLCMMTAPPPPAALTAEREGLGACNAVLHGCCCTGAFH